MASKASTIVFALSFTLLLIASDVVEGRTICEIKGPVVFPCLNGCSRYCYTGRKCRGRRCTGYRCRRLPFPDPRSQCYCRWRC